MKEIFEERVSTYMDRDVILLESTSSIAQASKIMRRGNYDSIIVCQNGKAIGIVTEHDIINSIAKGADPIHSSIDMIMSSPLITVKPDATLREAFDKMRTLHIRRVVVAEDGLAKGIIRLSTITRLLRTSKKKHISIKLIIGNLGLILQFAGILFVIPALLSAFLNETAIASSIFMMSVTLLASGFFLNSYGEKGSLNIRQASILVISSFVILIAVGTIPYLYLNPFNSSNLSDLLVNSFFESTTGFTTTGLSLLSNKELSQGFVFFKAFTQFVGGLNFIYLVMSIFYPEVKLTSIRSLLSGKYLHLKELFITLTMVFGIYIIILMITLYALGSQDVIDNISLLFSGLSTGGFLPPMALDGWYIQIIIMVIMILGSIPFTYHYTLIKRRFLPSKLSLEIIVFLIILASSSLLFTLLSGLEPLTAMFHTISASTTTGFQLIDVGNLNDGAKILLIILMYVGGTTFSTAGGIKIMRFIILAEFIKNLIYKDRSITLETSLKEIRSIITVIVLFPLTAYLSTVLLMNEGHDFLDTFFESTSAVTNTGLSTGITSQDLSNTSKLIIAIEAILGRFEIILILYIFIRSI